MFHKIHHRFVAGVSENWQRSSAMGEIDNLSLFFKTIFSIIRSFGFPIVGYLRIFYLEVKHHPLKRVASEFSVNGQSKEWAYTHFLGVTSGASRPG